MTTTTKTPSSKKKNLVNAKMTFAEIFQRCPDSIGVLFESGLHCVGCGMAQMETFEQGCLAHGMNKKQIDDLIKKINDEVERK